MLRYLMLLVAALWTAFIIVSCDDAYAATIQRNVENCFFLANVAQGVAENRDMGMPLATAREMMRDTIKEVMGKPGSLVQDADDAAYVMLMVESVYSEYVNLQPIDAGVKVLTACMTAPKQNLRKQRMA